MIGDVLVAVGLGLAMLVVVQNGYAAANITVESGQTLVSTGLYGLVRHPMYSGTCIMMVGCPACARLVLGTCLRHTGRWSRSRFASAMKKSCYEQELSGYREYEQQVHYRLVPYVW